MNELVKEYIEARQELINLVSKFQKEKRENVLFGNWTLKDIIAHLTGWAEHQTEVLQNLRKNKINKRIENIQAYNRQSVAKRKVINLNETYEEFIKITDSLISEYMDLPKNLWKKTIWKNKKYTPEKYITIEIRHYRKTHGPQIQEFLKNHPPKIAGR